MPNLLLIIGIGVIDVVATYVVGKHLQNTASAEIAKGVDEIVKQAPSLLAKAFMEGEDGERES
jgi:hypothetical protein